MTALNFGFDARSTRLWTTGYRDETDLSDLVGNVGARGFRRRCILTEGGKTACFIGPLWLPLFLQPKALVPLCPLDLTFQLSKPSFAIRSRSHHTKYRYNFRKFTMKVPRMKVAPSVASRLEQKLATEVAKYSIRNVSTRCFTINAGARKYDCDPFGIGTNTLPQTAIMALVATSSVQGVENESPFYFNNYNLTDISLNYEGQTLPTPSGFTNLTWSGDQENYMIAYAALFENTVKEDYGCGIQLEEFKKSFAFYRFSFGNYQTNSHDHQEPARIGSCRLSMTFAPPPTRANPCLTLLIFQERNNVIGVDGQRNIFRDFVL